MIVKLLWAFVGSLLVTTVTGVFLVPFLRKKKAGQSIREDGPVWHMGKSGTPTMGGIMFIAGIVFALVTGGIEEAVAGDWRHFIIFGFSIIFALIGFLDDYEKLKKKQNLGLTALQKFALQLAAAVVLILLLRLEGHLTTRVFIPFTSASFELPDWLYFIFAAFVIVGTVNAVNITDGIYCRRLGLFLRRPFRSRACGRARGLSDFQLLPGKDLYGRHGLAFPRRRYLRHGLRPQYAPSPRPARDSLYRRDPFRYNPGDVFQAQPRKARI